MTRIVKQHAVVQQDGVLEIHSPDLPAGAEAEVTVHLHTPRPTNGHTMSQYIGRGTGLYATATEVDSYIRELRAEWPR
ncbi:MAG: hypothetical protein WCS70_01200 [Verrucomicrobiota bacterium]